MLDPLAGVLEFVGVFEAVVAMQIAYALDRDESELSDELGRLVNEGLLLRVRVADDLAPVFRLTDMGRERIDRALGDLEPVQLSRVRHWIGVGWCWLAAHDGVFGPARLVLSRRQMVAVERADGIGGLFPNGGVRTFGRRLAPGARPVYPDVMVLIDAPGSPLAAVHLELASAPDLDFWRRLVGRYLQDRHVEAIVILVLSEQVRAVLAEAVDAVVPEGSKVPVVVRAIADGRIGFGTM